MNAQVDRILEQLEVGDMDNLRHMLGMTRPRASWGQRNYFLATPSTAESMARMQSLGVVEWRLTLHSGPVYSATRLGCQVAGLPARRIAEALS